MSKHLRLRRNWRRARRLSGGTVSGVLRPCPLTLKALARPTGIPALVMGYSTGYKAKSPPAPGGNDILDVDRRAERFVIADNCRITGIWR